MGDFNGSLVRGNLRVTEDANINGKVNGGPAVFDGQGNTPLILKNGKSNYAEGLRIMPANSWSDIVLGGNDASETEGISSNSWFLGNNNGNFYITRNGSSDGGHIISNTGERWRIKDLTSDTPLAIQSGSSATYLQFLNSSGNVLGYYAFDSNGNPCIYRNGNVGIILEGDSRLTNARPPYFANSTWYTVGDDCAIGDHDVGGTFCIKGLNAAPGIKLYSSDNSFYADVITSRHPGVQNGNVASYVPFPGIQALKDLGFLTQDYGTESYGHPDDVFLQAICRWCIYAYPNMGDITLTGSIAPNSTGTAIIHLYSSNGKDENNNPRYCAGLYTTLGGYNYNFGFVDFVWYYRCYSSSANYANSAGSAGTAESATYSSYPQGFTSRNTSDWSGVTGTLATDWSVNGADIMFKYDGSMLNVITDGRFYQGIDVYGSSQRVLDTYDLSHTSWDNANYLQRTNRLGAGDSRLQYCQYDGASDNPTNDWYSHIIMNHGNSAGYYTELATHFHGDDVYFRRQVSGTTYGWRRLAFSDEKLDCSYSDTITFSPTNNSFACSKSGEGWNAQVYSNAGWKTNCYVSFKPAQTSTYIMAGLNTDPTTSSSYDTLDYCWYCMADGTCAIYENSGYVSSHGNYSAFDEFRIEYADGYVNYYKNGVLCRRVARSVGSILYFDSSFYNSGSIVDTEWGALPHSFLPLTGGTMTGGIEMNSNTISFQGSTSIGSYSSGGSDPDYRLAFNSEDGRYRFYSDDGNNAGHFVFTSFTGSRSFTFPDNSGTVALTSDFTGTTSGGYWTSITINGTTAAIPQGGGGSSGVSSFGGATGAISLGSGFSMSGNTLQGAFLSTASGGTVNGDVTVTGGSNAVTFEIGGNYSKGTLRIWDGADGDYIDLKADTTFNRQTLFIPNEGDEHTIATQEWVSDRGYITSSGSCSYASSAGYTSSIARIWQRDNDCDIALQNYHNRTTVFMYDDSSANKPSGSSAGYILANAWDWGGGGSLLAQDHGTGGRLYTRHRPCSDNYDASWGSWNAVAWVSEIPTNNNQLTNGAGYITGITSSMVTTALGYTPGTSNFTGYTASNKLSTDYIQNDAGYITSSGSCASATTATTATKIAYTTTAPSQVNPGGLKVVVLTSEPAEYKQGYIYFIVGS